MLFRTPLVLLSALAVAILWGCTSGNQGTLPDADFFPAQGQLFSLQVGDTAGIPINSAIALVRFSAVVDDNRCPENVTCLVSVEGVESVTSGHATVLLTVQSTLKVSDVEVQVPPGKNVDVVVEVEELTLTLHEVTPAAQDGVEIGLLEYAVVMSVRQTADIGL